MSDLNAAKMSIFVMPSGRTAGLGSTLKPLALQRHGLTSRSINNLPTVSQDYSTDRYGRIVVRRTYNNTPAGLDTFSINVLKVVEESYLDKRARAQDSFPVWRMFSPCVSKDNPQGWQQGGQLEFWGNCRVTSGGSETDSPVVDGSNPTVTETVPITTEYYLKFLPLTISNLTFTSPASNSTDLFGLLVLNDPIPQNCVSAYRGPGRHLMAVQEAVLAAEAKVFYSVDGGGSWAAMSADPFGTNEDISHIVGGITTGNVFRVAVGRGTTDAGNAAEIAYGDITFGAEGTITWTLVDVGSNTGDIITMMAHILPQRDYYATDNGTLHVSEDQHESNSLIYTGNQINCAVKGVGDCDDVWFGGASNTILVERNAAGIVTARVGPAGGGAFTALALSNDGGLFAGNGQTLYVSYNEAANATGWSTIKDFGASHVIKKIFLPEGDPYNIYVVVDDTTPGNGEFWHSNDAGNSWTLVTELTNGGYNDASASIESPNEFWIVGDDDGANGVVHKITGVTGGCS